MNPSSAGMTMAVVSMCTMMVGPVSGWLSDRYGRFVLAALGAGMTMAGTILMRGFSLEISVWLIVAVLVPVRVRNRHVSIAQQQRPSWGRSDRTAWARLRP